MRKKTIQGLLMVGLLTSTSSMWGQSVPVADASSVMLEITDLFGDKQAIPISDGMTLYWPQALIGNERAFAVLCDKSGAPQYRFPVGHSDLSSLRFLNAPATSTPANMSQWSVPEQDYANFYENGTYSFPTGLRFDISGKPYAIPRPGELHFSSPMGTYELITADGQHLTIPLAATDLIHYQDSLQGMSSYLRKFGEDALDYLWAFFNGEVVSQNMLKEDFYAMVPSGSYTNMSLLVPSDAAFSFVPYIISYTAQQATAFNIQWKGNAAFPFTTGRILYPYNFQTGELDTTPRMMEQLSQTSLQSYFAHMLHSHTIMHRYENREKGLNSGNDYYLALDGSPIRVIREGSQVTGFQSAFHLWNQQHGLTAMSGGSPESLTKANITKRRSKENGTIYGIDNTLEATPSSVYSILSGSELAEGEANPFERFFEICQMSGAFVQNGGLDGYGLDFIGNIPFTLYVPTNEAIEQEMGSVLSEIDALNEQLNAAEDYDETIKALEDQLAEKQKSLLPFVKAHIQFGIEIADQLPFQREHRTVVVKESTLATPLLNVRGTGNGHMSVTDECGNTRNIIDAHKNIFVREAHCILDPNGTGDGKPTSPQGRISLNNIVLGSYANGVIHQIDGVLRYNP